MDGALKDAGNAMAAMVVRQFSPSRLECQLLAQVFDLVCDQHCAVDDAHSTIRSAVPTHCVGDSAQAIVTHVARRRAS